MRRKRFTPTQYAREGGLQYPVQLGSIEAVLAAMPDRATIVVADCDGYRRVGDALSAAGRARDAVKVTTAGVAALTLYELARETVIGVEPGAFDRVFAETYAAAHAALGRFDRVIWG